MASFLPSALHHLAPPWESPSCLTSALCPLPFAFCPMKPSCPLTPGSAVTSGPCQRQLREAKQGRGRPGERERPGSCQKRFSAVALASCGFSPPFCFPDFRASLEGHACLVRTVCCLALTRRHHCHFPRSLRETVLTWTTLKFSIQKLRNSFPFPAHSLIPPEPLTRDAN